MIVAEPHAATVAGLVPPREAGACEQAESRRQQCMSGDQIRKTRAMWTSPRCGAETRNGTTCRAPAVHGKSRCRMHGGARRSGAPKGNQNARTHGEFTGDAAAERAQDRAVLNDALKLLAELSRVAE
ncbi:HGGxSTG domain-containing protein [Bradyrhizobium sp. 187]|uniref:HGGxSTG domain-containing protein n=2 Tax=Nitrobacteraceae TaxID=41294 RepID=UPI0031FBB633